jgi:hypothetical protein
MILNFVCHYFEVETCLFLNVRVVANRVSANEKGLAFCGGNRLAIAEITSEFQ